MKEIKEIDVIETFGRCNDTESDDTFKRQELVIENIIYELTGPACCIKQAIKIIKSDIPKVAKHWHWNGVHYLKSYPITGKLETKFELYPTLILRVLFRKHKSYKEAPLSNRVNGVRFFVF